MKTGSPQRFIKKGFQNSSCHEKSGQSNFNLPDNPAHRIFFNKQLISFTHKSLTPFSSAIASIQRTEGDKKTKKLLINLLTGMNASIERVSKEQPEYFNPTSFISPLSEEDSEVIEQITRNNPEHSILPKSIMPKAIHNYVTEEGYFYANESEIIKPDMSEYQISQLTKNLATYIKREYIRYSTIQILNHNKNLPEFKPFKDSLEKIIENFDNKILLVGLSSETKEIVQKLQKDIGLKLDTPDIPKLVRILDEQLRLYKHSEINYELPDRITLNDFMQYLNQYEIKTYGTFLPACRETLHEEELYNYFNNNGYIGKTIVTINPFVYHGQLDDNNNFKPGQLKDFMDILQHEMGHFWHFKKLGLHEYLTKCEHSLILTDKEEDILNDFILLAEQVEPDWPPKHSLNIDTIIDYYNYTAEGRNPFGSKFSQRLLKDMAPIINKGKDIIDAHKIINEEIPYTFQAHAKTAIAEIIAFSVMLSPQKSFNKATEEFLQRHGMPELKDRCLIKDKPSEVKDLAA